MSKTTCAECGKEIPKGEYYIEVCDNYLRFNYFDRDEDAIFCSDECLKDALSCEEIEVK